MSLSAISGNIATAQLAAATVQTSQPPATQQPSNPNAGQDTVTISAAAQQALSTVGDVNHDGDSH